MRGSSLFIFFHPGGLGGAEAGQSTDRIPESKIFHVIFQFSLWVANCAFSFFLQANAQIPSPPPRDDVTPGNISEGGDREVAWGSYRSCRVRLPPNFSRGSGQGPLPDRRVKLSQSVAEVDVFF